MFARSLIDQGVRFDPRFNILEDMDFWIQCLPLTPFLRGEPPRWWRSAAHYEWDWRDWYLARSADEWPWDRRLERRNLVVQRGEHHAYVHFGDGSWRCFDLAADPTWRTLTEDPQVVLKQAQALLDWRTLHLDRTLTNTLIDKGVVGRIPRRDADIRGDRPS